MITISKLKMFDSYKGSIDNFGHAPSRDRKVISDSDFSIIEGLIQDVKLGQKGMVSDEYSKKVKERLVELCENSETIEYLKLMAMRY